MVYGLLGFIAGTLFSALGGIAAAIAAYFVAGKNAVNRDLSNEQEVQQQRERLKKQYENLMRYDGSSNSQVDIESDWR